MRLKKSKNEEPEVGNSRIGDGSERELQLAQHKRICPKISDPSTETKIFNILIKWLLSMYTKYTLHLPAMWMDGEFPWVMNGWAQVAKYLQTDIDGKSKSSLQHRVWINAPSHKQARSTATPLGVLVVPLGLVAMVVDGQTSSRLLTAWWAEHREHTGSKSPQVGQLAELVRLHLGFGFFISNFTTDSTYPQPYSAGFPVEPPEIDRLAKFSPRIRWSLWLIVRQRELYSNYIPSQRHTKNIKNKKRSFIAISPCNPLPWWILTKRILVWSTWSHERRLPGLFWLGRSSLKIPIECSFPLFH